MKDFIPILKWLPEYDSKLLKGDLSAGLTVGIMLIPQGMAYAMIAGLPAIYGLYASTVPLILYALLGSSRQLAVGPVAMVSLLTASGISTMAEIGSEAYISLAILLALLVGAIQFVLGLFRLGFLVNFLSHPVISGFTSAAAIIIGLSQLKHLLGVDIPRAEHIHEIIIHAASNIENIHFPTLAIGLGGIAIIVGIKRWNGQIPGQLLAVVFGIVLVWGFQLDESGMGILGTVPSGLPDFAVPTLQLEHIRQLLPIAGAISLVSFMESIAVAKAVQSRHKNYEVSANQELIALGASNIGGAFFQAFPTTGGFSRTAVNDQAGAKTGMASIISAALIILTLLFLTPLFYYLPKAILASVIMVAVAGLVDFKEALFLWRTDRTDFIMLLVTFVATLFLGIEEGIGIGVMLSLAMVIYQTTRPHIAILGKVPESSFYRNVNRFDDLEVRKDLLIMRFDAQLYFANIAYFKDELRRECRKKKETLKAVIINSESIVKIDSSAIHALEDIIEDLRREDVQIFFAGLRGPVRDAMARTGLIDKIGSSHLSMDVAEAVDLYDAEKEDPSSDHESYLLQNNA